MRSLILILAFISASYAFVDMRSESTFQSIVLPLCVVLGFVALALWFVGWLYQRGANQRVQHGAGDFWSSDGDSGC